VNSLRAEFVKHTPSNQGIKALINLIEPNGDQHMIHCLCNYDGTTNLDFPNDHFKYPDIDMAKYFLSRYSHQTVLALARNLTLQ